MSPPSRLIVWKNFQFYCTWRVQGREGEEIHFVTQKLADISIKNCRQKFYPQLKKYINLTSPANWLRQQQQFHTSPVHHKTWFCHSAHDAALTAPAKNKAPHSLTSAPYTASAFHRMSACATSLSCYCATAAAAGLRPSSAAALAYPPAADCAKALSFS